MKGNNTLEAKWDKANKRSKEWYQFVSASLFRTVPLMLVLIIVLEFINNFRNEDFILFLVSAVFKLMLTYLLGVLCGSMEWNFMRALIQREFVSFKAIKKKYVFIYGVMFFGCNVTIALINPIFESPVLTLIKLIIYLLSGWLWGVLMVNVSGGSLDRFVNTN